MNKEIETKTKRRNSVHPTTLRERQKRFHDACVQDYERHLNLGGTKRKLRRFDKSA